MQREMEMQSMFNVTSICGFFQTELEPDAFTGWDETVHGWEMLYCTDGCRDYAAAGVRVHLVPGTAVFLPPESPHRSFCCGVRCRIRYMVFRCGGDAIWQLAGRVIPLDAEETEMLCGILGEGESCFSWEDGICSEAGMVMTREPAPEEISSLKLRIELFFTRLAHDHPAPVSLDADTSRRRAASDGLLYCRACAMMEEKPDGTLTPEGIAASLGVSLSSLKRIFREQAKGGIREHYNAVRLETAKTMLRAGAGNITEISERLGYSSPFYFSRVFRAAFGVSPMEYAKGARPAEDKNIPRKTGG